MEVKQLYEIINSCLAQKNKLAIIILDCTKQIEVQLKQENTQIDKLIEKRKQCMDRIDKCTALIKSTIDEFPCEKRKQLENAVKGQTLEDLNQDEMQIATLSKSYMEWIKKIRIADKMANDVMIRFHDNLKFKVKKERETAKKTRDIFPGI